MPGMAIKKWWVKLIGCCSVAIALILRACGGRCGGVWFYTGKLLQAIVQKNAFFYELLLNQ
jgi:hypothetical protein